MAVNTSSCLTAQLHFLFWTLAANWEQIRCFMAFLRIFLYVAYNLHSDFRHPAHSCVYWHVFHKRINSWMCATVKARACFCSVLPDRSSLILNVMDVYQCLMGNRGLGKDGMKHTHACTNQTACTVHLKSVYHRPPTHTHTHSVAVLPFLIPFISLCSLFSASKSRVRGVIC